MNPKPLFDAVRHLLGRSFNRREIQLLDTALDQILRQPACDETRPVGPHGIALIKRFEGCARRDDGLVEAYPDPGTGAEPWTIGWGATGQGIESGTIWTQQQCDDRLAADLARYAAEVTRALDGAATSQLQFDALVSFHYNTGAIDRATLTCKHKKGDWEGALGEFARWNRAGGRVLHGLKRRRAAEAALYRAGLFQRA
jgi:GH24 family phage-related lysozyme (muramidase)